MVFFLSWNDKCNSQAEKVTSELHLSSLFSLSIVLYFKYCNCENNLIILHYHAYSAAILYCFLKLWWIWWMTAAHFVLSTHKKSTNCSCAANGDFYIAAFFLYFCMQQLNWLKVQAVKGDFSMQLKTYSCNWRVK